MQDEGLIARARGQGQCRLPTMDLHRLQAPWSSVETLVADILAQLNKTQLLYLSMALAAANWIGFLS